MTIPEQMFELCKSKKRYSNKKAFDCILSFIAYCLKIDSVATPPVSELIFNYMIHLSQEYIKQPLNYDLINLYYKLKIQGKTKPKLEKRNYTAKFLRQFKKNIIVVQHNDLKVGDAIINIKECYPDKNIIHYGYCHSITEYHTALVCSKLFNIDAHLLFVNEDMVDKTRSPEFFIANYMFINQWAKPSKKDLKPY